MHLPRARSKVLYLTASYPTAEASTSGVFVREHARAAARYADVAVVHLRRTDGVRGLRRVVVERGEEMPTWRVDYPRTPLPVSYAGVLAAASAGVRAARAAGFRPDLIHAHFFLAAAPAVLLGRMLRVPVVTTEHWSVFLPSDPLQLGRLNRQIAKFAFDRSDVVLPVSDALRDGIRAIGTQTRFRVIPNAVDTELFYLAPTGVDGEVVRLLTVSGLYEAKGYEFLLGAVAKLGERGVALHLDVVGDGVGRPKYEALARKLGISDLVTFRGEQPKEEVGRFMRAADLFVLASRYENNPCALLEAQVSGLPVVATRVGGVPELVTAETGALAAPCDADDLADKIETVIRGLGTYDRAAIAAEAVGRYGLASVGSALAEVYEDALRRRARHGAGH